MSKRIRVFVRAVVLLAMAAVSLPVFCTTVTWDGGGPDDFWSTPANWSANSLPTVSDDVVITNASGAVWVDLNPTVGSITVQTGATLRVEPGWVVTVNNASTVNTGGFLHILPGGTFSGNGALTLNGTLIVEGGTLSGSGALTVSSSGVMDIGSATGISVISRSITNAGTINFVSSSTMDTTFDGATLTNNGTINFQNNFDINPGVGSPILNNNSGGVITKSNGIGTTEINVTVNNAAGATISTQSGDIELNGGGMVSGDYAIASSKFIRLRGGTYTMSGTPTLSGAGRLLIHGATLAAGAGVDVTWSNIDLQAGTITGAGALRVSGNFNWFGGTISGSGPRVLNNTSTPTISCSAADCQLDGATLRLQAWGTYSASANALRLSNGASLILDPGQVLFVTNDGDFLSGGGAASSITVGGRALGVNGCIQKTTTAGTSVIDVPVTLFGSFMVVTGTLQVGADVTVAGTEAIVHYDPGTAIEVTGGTFQFNSGAVLFPANGTFKVSSGTLRVATGVTLTIPNMTLQGGVVDGAGDLHLGGNFAWLGGTIVGGGARVLDSTSTPVISCSAGHCNLDGTTATLQMNASATFNATANSLVFFNAASLVIAPGKTLNITTDGTIVGLGTITNNGTLTKSGGTGIRSIGTVLHNNGNVIVTAGGLSLLGNGTHAGSFTVTAPGTLAFDGGAHTLAGGVSGTGILAVNGAAVTLDSTGTAGGFVMSGGTLGGSGTLTLANGGTWTGGTMSGSGATAVAAGKTLAVSGFPTLNGRALDLGAGAMLDLTGQMLAVPSAASVTGSGTVRVNGGTLRVLSGVTQTIPNLTLSSGVIDGAGALHVSGNFNWSGGTIAGSGERVLAGTSTPAISCSGANCLLDGSTLRLQASGIYSASGNALVLSNGASLILDPGQTINVSNDGDFVNGGGAASSIVIGGFAAGFNACIWKTATPGTSVIGIPVTMSGSFKADAGTLQVAADVTAAAGAIVHYSVGATVEMTAGLFLLNASGIFFLDNGDFKVSGGTLRVPAGVTVTMPNVTLQGSGVIDGGGTLILSGGNNWLGGTMGSAAAPGGITRIDSGHGLNVTPVVPSSLTRARQLLNNGTLAYGSVGANILTMSGNSRITNHGAVVFHDGTIALSGSALIENFGSMTKVAGTGTTAIVPPVDNNSGATVSVPAGTIALSGGGLAAGAYAVSSGATLTLGGGTFTVAGTSTVTGAGTLSIDGAILDAGTGIDVTYPNLTLSAGAIAGAGTVRVSGNFTWSGGTIAGSGPKVLTNTSMPAISCAAGNCLLDGGTLRLQAWGTYSAASNDLVFSNGASLILDPGKVLFVTSDGDFVSGSGGGSITIGGFAAGVNGCIEKTTTSGTSIIGVPVTMAGSFKTVTGTLQFAADVTAAAGAIVHYDPGTTVEVTGGVFLTSGAVSFPAPGTFKVSAGTLRVPTGVSITTPNVTLQGSGVIDGGGTLILSGTSTWTGGTMGSAAAPGGVTRIGSGSTLNILGSSAPQSLAHTRQLLNDGTVSYGGIGANTLTMSGGSRITNNGTLNLTNNSVVNNTPAGSAVIENHGTFARTTGTGASTLFPRFENNSGATVSVATGTGIQLWGGGIAAGAYAISSGAGLTLAPGTFTVTGTSTVTGAGTLVISDATVDISSGASVSWPNVSFTGGTIGGAGALHVTGAFTWSGGTIAGTGTRSLDSSSTPVIDGGFGNCTLDGAALQFHASATFSAPGSLVFLNGASLTVDAGKTLSITGNGDFLSGAGGGAIVNNGTIAKQTAAGTSTIGVPLTMQAASAIDLDAGTLQLGGGADAAGGATIDLAGGTALEVTAGVWLFGSGPVSMPGSGTFKVLGGALRVPAGVTTTIPNLTLQGSGVLDGGGTLILSGTSTWAGGTMGSAAAPGGVTRIDAGDTLNITAAVTLADGRTLQNDGTLSLGGNVLGSGTIANNGTLTAVGNRTIGAALNNGGQLATGSTLSLAGGGTHSGSFTVTAPGNLSFSSGTHSVSGGGSIAGNGTLTFGGATATVGVPVNVGTLSVTAGTATLDAGGSADAFTMTGGTLGGSGTLTLTGGGSWSGGTMSGTGTTVIPATKTLDVSAPVTLVSRILQNHGTLTVSGSVLGSGTIDNQGTLSAVGNGTIGVTVNNSGQLATSGALSLTGGGTHTGSFSVTAPGNLSFSSGTHSVTGSGSIGGSGTLTFSGATTTVAVPVNVGSLSVTSGTATLDVGGSAGAFTMTGGTLGGSGTLTLTNGGTWSGGAMSGTGTTVIPAAKTLTVSAPVTLDGRTLQNTGTLSLSAGVAGSGTIANDGTLSALGDVAIGASLNNSGQTVTGALLSLGGNGTHSGTFTANAPGTIDFSGGSQTVSGTLAGTGTLRFSGAAVTVTGAWSGMPVEVTGGSVAFDTNGTIPELTLSGGTLAGSADVTVSGPSSWSGGTLAGSGGFTFDTGATVAMPGTTAATVARPLLNKGTINFNAASEGMLIDGVAVRNQGTFNVRSSRGIAATAGTPSFVNAGTLKKSSGSGILQFGPPLANSGQVRIESGTMHFGAKYAQSAGTTTVLAGATLQTATLTLSGGSLTGNGRIAGTVANGATVSPGASPGTLTISGDYVQSSGGELAIELAGTAGTQYDRLLVSGSVTLGGTLDVTTRNGFVPAPGNAFQILSFGSRAGGSTFDVTDGLTISGTELAPVFTASGLHLVASRIPVADVAVAVTGPVSTTAGTEAIYTITVSNGGPDAATSVAVTATASPGLAFSRNSGACTGSFPCSIGTLAAGQSATILTAWEIAPSATGSVRLTVNAGSATDANSSNNSDSATTSIGTCPIITILAPGEMISGETAQATATIFRDATYRWSIDGGTIEAGQGTSTITFTAGEPGTLRLGVSVTGGACTLGAALDVTVAPPLACVGTATPAAPADGTSTSDAVDFAWNAVEGASGYRLWLEQDGVPARSLGTTLDTSRTKIVSPGAYRWYVETLFDGCASQESERRTLAILPADDCPSRVAPQLNAPANETPVTNAAVDFSWSAVDRALEYELWLAPVGGVPTLIHTTSDTSYTAVVPPGRLEWYVRAVFAGCPATESGRRAFTCTPPPECTSERPLLIAPLEGERLTSPLSFEWRSVSGATSYELYVDGVLAAATTSPHAAGLSVPRGERRWHVRARLAEGCGAVDSAESRLVVVAPAPSCAPLGAPVITAPARISSGVAGRIQWSFVAGATAYVVELASNPRFPRESTSSSTVAARQLPFTFTNEVGAPLTRYVRVHAIDTNCVERGTGAFSPVAEVSVLPPAGSANGSEGATLLTDPTDVEYTLTIAADRAGQSFTATPTVPWISVTPASGIVPPEGQTLRAVARTAGLPPGTNIGSVDIATTAPAAGKVATLASFPPVKLTVSVNGIPGVTTAPKSTPPPDALTIPAVASVTNFIVRYNSDISVTNTSAQVMKYEIDFVPSGQAGMSEGQKTNVSLEPGATMAVNDIVATWFGGRSSTGTLEIRPLTEIDTSTSSAPVGGLANRTTFASSRTFSTTAAGGTYGQYVPAVPYANFVAKGTTLSLQHIAQSDRYRTNLGLVEGSGEQVSLEVRIFDAAGTKRAAFNVDLNGGERAQLNGVLAEHGITLDDGRIEVEVTSGDGKVTAYASVVDNVTNDPQLVPPVTLGQTGHSKWVVPGVADLVTGSGNWRTDVRVFNAGTETAELTLAFHSMNGGPAATRTIELAAGEVRQFDRVLSLFAVSGDAGALHVSSAAPARVVVTARTYNQTDAGAFGQFINAVTPDEAVSAGSRPLQILQMEESDRFRSNIGFAEVSGKPVTLEVAVFRPGSNDPSVLTVPLEANQFRQLNSLIASLGLGELYNARISVRAIDGEGRAMAYGSLIDQKTGDPTYIPGQ